MSAIFVSYRRGDTLSATGHLVEKLAAAFGSREIFRDLQAIEAGADFRTSLADALRAARVVIVVVGPSWLRSSRVDERPRLYEAEDYVRLEIETALSYDLPIIPVLVERAMMPKPAELPESLRPLAFRQAHELSETRWDYDVDRLIDLVATLANLPPPARPTAGRGAVGESLPALLRDAVINVPADFLRLFYMPRRFLAMRGADSRGDLLRALAFLAVLQLAGAAIVLLEWPTRSRIPQFLLTPAMVALSGALTVSLPLYFAWRLVGARREYRRVLIILLYQSSMVGFMESIVLLITLIAVRLQSPAAISDLSGNLTINGLSDFSRALESGSGAPLAVTAFVDIFIILAVLVWLAITWGAYRDVLRQSRARSLAALALVAMFCGAPVAFLVWVASLFRT